MREIEGLILIVSFICHNLFSQACEDTLFRVVDTSQISDEAIIQYNLLSESEEFIWTQVITLTEIDSLLNGESISCYLPLDQNPRCASFSQYAYFIEPDGFLWSGLNYETGETIELSYNAFGNGGYLNLCMDGKVQYYLFVGLSKNEVAVVRYSDEFVRIVLGSELCGMDSLAVPIMYPNPVVDIGFIEHVNFDLVNEIELFDITGRELPIMWTLDSIDKAVLNTSKLIPGTYIISVVMESREVVNFKFIKK